MKTKVIQKMQEAGNVVENAQFALSMKARRIAGCILIPVYSVFGSSVVFAANEAEDAAEKKAVNSYDFLNDSATGTNKSIDGITTQVQNIGVSIYKLLIVLGVVGLGCSIVFTGFMLATQKNAQKREESKSQLIWIAIGGIIIFGAMTLIGILAGIASTISV